MAINVNNPRGGGSFPIDAPTEGVEQKRDSEASQDPNRTLAPGAKKSQSGAPLASQPGLSPPGAPAVPAGKPAGAGRTDSTDPKGGIESSKGTLTAATGEADKTRGAKAPTQQFVDGIERRVDDGGEPSALMPASLSEPPMLPPGEGVPSRETARGFQAFSNVMIELGQGLGRSISSGDAWKQIATQAAHLRANPEESVLLQTFGGAQGSQLIGDLGKLVADGMEQDSAVPREVVDLFKTMAAAAAADPSNVAKTAAFLEACVDYVMAMCAQLLKGDQTKTKELLKKLLGTLQKFEEAQQKDLSGKQTERADGMLKVRKLKDAMFLISILLIVIIVVLVILAIVVTIVTWGATAPLWVMIIVIVCTAVGGAIGVAECVVMAMEAKDMDVAGAKEVLNSEFMQILKWICVIVSIVASIGAAIANAVSQAVIQAAQAGAREIATNVGRTLGNEVSAEVRREVERVVREVVQRTLESLLKKIAEEGFSNMSKELMQTMIQEAMAQMMAELTKELVKSLGEEVGQQVAQQIAQQVAREVMVVVAQQLAETLASKLGEEVGAALATEVMTNVAQQTGTALVQDVATSAGQEALRAFLDEAMKAIQAQIQAGVAKGVEKATQELMLRVVNLLKALMDGGKSGLGIAKAGVERDVAVADADSQQAMVELQQILLEIQKIRLDKDALAKQIKEVLEGMSAVGKNLEEALTKMAEGGNAVNRYGAVSA